MVASSASGRGLSIFGLKLAFILALFISGTPAQAQVAGPGMAVGPANVNMAPVVIDGRTLFLLRGITSYPAELRAGKVRNRIIELARDESFSISSLSVQEREDGTVVIAGETEVLVTIYDVDAQLEGVKRQLLAKVFRERIAHSITDYRRDRSSTVLIQNTVYAFGVTVALVLLLFITQRVFRWLLNWAERHVRSSLQQLASKSHYLVNAHQVWRLFGGLLRFTRTLVYLLLAYVYLNTVLGIYPWTRPTARVLFHLVVDPVLKLWLGFLGALPNLIFLVILYLVVRYLLKLIRAYFTGVRLGRIKLERFEPDWSEPTFRIVRILVIAFALVIAYPYIPGSDSLAFKGVTVFMGVLLSLGSSSFIANLIAGLTMTYRGAFKVGDRVQVGDVIGTVEDIKLMTTRVCTPKNERVIIPNSNILTTNVTNFSQEANEGTGVLLHTAVGIGYDVSWRQVEAMLIEAASRSKGLEAKPAPFVIQTALDDFAAIYEINARWDAQIPMALAYSSLHANIQDVFNENGVQIMSPAYVADPDSPKIVPPGEWAVKPLEKSEPEAS